MTKDEIIDLVKRMKKERSDLADYTTFIDRRSSPRIDPEDFDTKRRLRELFKKASRGYEDLHGVGSRIGKEALEETGEQTGARVLKGLGKTGGGLAAGLAALMATSGDANAAIDELDVMGKLGSGELPEDLEQEKEEYNRTRNMSEDDIRREILRRYTK